MSRILVIDDDRELAELLREYLVPEGFSIDTAYDHSSGLAKALKAQDDLVVLDVMLPGGSGFELLKKLRGAGAKVPVLLLTARGEAVDRIVGLEIGADDYLPKPFDPRELLARIRAILRRPLAEPGAMQAGEITVGDVRLDPASRSAFRGQESLELTAVEFDLLETLLRSAGSIVRREQLAKTVLGRELNAFDRSIDMHVSKLRRKLGNLPGGQERIKTIRSVGYLYAQPTPHKATAERR